MKYNKNYILKSIAIVIYSCFLIDIILFNKLTISKINHYIYIAGFTLLLLFNIKKKNRFFILIFVEAIIILCISLIKTLY